MTELFDAIIILLTILTIVFLSLMIDTYIL